VFLSNISRGRAEAAVPPRPVAATIAVGVARRWESVAKQRGCVVRPGSLADGRLLSPAAGRTEARLAFRRKRRDSDLLRGKRGGVVGHPRGEMNTVGVSSASQLVRGTILGLMLVVSSVATTIGADNPLLSLILPGLDFAWELSPNRCLELAPQAYSVEPVDRLAVWATTRRTRC